MIGFDKKSLNERVTIKVIVGLSVTIKLTINFISYKKRGIKKGKQKFTFFCPKSTMNLTYLCYGDTKVY